MKQVLYHRIFEPKAFGHGGERRAAQLAEWFDSQGVERHYYPLRGIEGFRSICWSMRLVLQTYGWTILRHPKSLWRAFRFISYNYTKNLQDFFKRPEKTLLIEGTIEEFQVLFTLAKRYKKDVIAFPHNLESLVPKSRYLIGDGEKMAAFSNEIKCMQSCKAVFCISQEESWLLRLWGINAYYLPYYPPKQTETYLLEIRRERLARKTPTKCILMAGSALNGPTAQGMQQVMNYWKYIDGCELRVAGYGTIENLRQPQSGNIQMLGAISDQQMREEMINCDALLILQPPTTGALTRIQEALLAGIPVIANDNAARDYHHIGGIYEYANIEELQDILSKDLNIPAQPKQIDYTNLLNLIK